MKHWQNCTHGSGGLRCYWAMFGEGTLQADDGEVAMDFTSLRTCGQTRSDQISEYCVFDSVLSRHLV